MVGYAGYNKWGVCSDCEEEEILMHRTLTKKVRPYFKKMIDNIGTLKVEKDLSKDMSIISAFIIDEYDEEFEVEEEKDYNSEIYNIPSGYQQRMRGDPRNMEYIDFRTMREYMGDGPK